MAKKHRYVKRALNVIVFNYQISWIEFYTITNESFLFNL